MFSTGVYCFSGEAFYMKVGLVMGSDSDLPVMRGALEICEEFGVDCEVLLASAHRTPEAVKEFAEGAADRGIGCIIAGAGMAAHLAGIVAAFTTLPVIGVPLEGGSFKGMDALLATVQMPTGVPVATVAVNGAKNGALLALQILAVSDRSLAAKYKKYRENMTEQIIAKNAALQKQLQHA